MRAEHGLCTRSREEGETDVQELEWLASTTSPHHDGEGHIVAERPRDGHVWRIAHGCGYPDLLCGIRSSHKSCSCRSFAFWYRRAPTRENCDKRIVKYT